jgi:DNA-directed RNA polymerase I, II, and III subunit RPABC2
MVFGAWCLVFVVAAVAYLGNRCVMSEIVMAVGGGVPVRTSAFLSRFEYARLVGLVTLRMACSNSGYVGYSSDSNMMRVAEDAILCGQINAVIRRPLPDGTFEDCNLRELSLQGIPL